MGFEQQKRELRSSFRQRADLFQAHNSAVQVERFNENLISFLKNQRGIWAGFKAMGYEPRLEKAIQSTPHLRWVYPRMVHDHIEFVETAKFQTGTWGFEEPVGGTVVALGDISGILVPGIAFDRQGGRLGRGKGHYDRVLSKTHRGLKVGVGFSFQIYQGLLPRESFDVTMDAILSEQGLRWAEGRLERA